MANYKRVIDKHGKDKIKRIFRVKKNPTWLRMNCGNCGFNYKMLKPNFLPDDLYIYCPNCQTLNFVLIPNKDANIPPN